MALVDWLVDWLIGWLVGWFVGWLVRMEYITNLLNSNPLHTSFFMVAGLSHFSYWLELNFLFLNNRI